MGSCHLPTTSFPMALWDKDLKRNKNTLPWPTRVLCLGSFATQIPVPLSLDQPPPASFRSLVLHFFPPQGLWRLRTVLQAQSAPNSEVKCRFPGKLPWPPWTDEASCPHWRLSWNQGLLLGATCHSCGCSCVFCLTLHEGTDWLPLCSMTCFSALHLADIRDARRHS